jgi:hypothetical protein
MEIPYRPIHHSEKSIQQAVECLFRGPRKRARKSIKDKTAWDWEEMGIVSKSEQKPIPANMDGHMSD